MSPSMYLKEGDISVNMMLCFRDTLKSLIQVGDYIIDMFGAYRKADRILTDACIGQFFFGQLTVRGGGRMDDQTFNVGYIGQQREYFQIVDKPESLFASPFYQECKNRCAAIRKIFFVQSVIRMVRKRRMIDFFHLRMRIQVLHDFFCVFNMAFQTKAECFCALKEQKSCKGADAGAFIPQKNRTDVGGKSGFSGSFCKF